jgi:pimeloyl-ACP methyl ester carboxylesterase
MITTIVVSLALLGLRAIKRAEAGTVLRKSPASEVHRPCSTFTIQIPIIAQNHVFDLIPVNSNIDATHYAQDLDTWNSPSILERIERNITISRTYDIHAELCIPLHGDKKSLLQIASHGGGYDSRYWDAPGEHSYIDAALSAGYSILTYDRIGVGQSTIPNAYTDVQLPAEVEVLRVLTERVRDGTVLRLASTARDSHWYPGLKFDKIIHVGHSLGSITTYGLISVYPNVSDAAILTGFLIDSQVFNSRQTAMGYAFAPQADHNLFSHFPSGYVVQATPGAVQTGFFSSRVNTTTNIGGFDPDLLEYGFQTRQPSAEPEMLSGIAFYADHPTAPGFASPLQLVIGEFDFIVCRGDCRHTYNLTMLKEMFPRTSDLDVYLQPGTGHALPFHNNATLGFQASFDWLSKNGL